MENGSHYFLACLWQVYAIKMVPVGVARFSSQFLSIPCMLMVSVHYKNDSRPKARGLEESCHVISYQGTFGIMYGPCKVLQVIFDRVAASSMVPRW